MSEAVELVFDCSKCACGQFLATLYTSGGREKGRGIAIPTQLDDRSTCTFHEESAVHFHEPAQVHV